MVKLLCVLFITCYSFGLTSGQCCYSKKGFGLDNIVNFFNPSSNDNGDCDDGTKGTPCCGYGRCNWNCCECSTPCRQKDKTLEQALEEERLAKNPHLHAQEARLILPKQKNNGESLDNLRQLLEDRLLKEFGGFTRDESNGGWQDNASGRVYKEPVWVYDITSAGTDEQIIKLIDIAKWLLQDAEQEAIYLRLPGGKVTFVVD